jgi:predicted component of type VI protein secretion system
MRMNIKQLFQRLFGTNKQESSSPQNGMQADKSEMMQKMFGMLSNTRDKELTCDEVFALLDQFAELAAQGEDVAQLMPLVKQHLDMCEDCREEYKVLARIVQGTA